MNCVVNVLVDDEDAWILEQKPWHFAYGQKKLPFITVMVDPVKQHRRMLHHIVLCGENKCSTACGIIHINGDTTDNRKSNLKKISFAFSQTMRANRTDTKSGYRGVYYRADNKNLPWIAVVKCEGKRQHLGAYATKEEAAQIVDDFRREIYGDKIPLNLKK